MIESNEGLQWHLKIGTNEFCVGITESALDSIGSIIGVDLGEPDDEYSPGDWIGEIQGKNAVVELLAPFALKITEVNSELGGEWEALESDPTGDAWILRVEKV